MSEPSQAVRDLVASANLIDVTFFELVARRAGNFSAAVETESAAEFEPTYGLGVETSEDETRFRLRLRIDIEGPFGAISAEAAAEYERGAFPLELMNQRLLVEYANNVGLMVLLPYLRQAIADLTQRVFGSALLMPILQRGAVSFTVGDEVTSAIGPEGTESGQAL